MHTMFLILSLLLAVSLQSINSKPLDGISFENAGQIHAVLVSAVPSNDAQCRLNYAPEAETAQTYHFLIDNGVPAENIILFMNDGFTSNESCNPFPGTLYTDVNKSRNYNEGLKIDYSGKEVTVQNYLAVLMGEKSLVVGGSGRVLNSSENDRVFVSHEGHGDDGVLVVSDSGVMTSLELNNALKYANVKKMFKELIYYIMACRSGSMFEGQLDPTGNIYALTAASPGQDTSAYQNITFTEDGEKYELYINTEFGNAWHLDSIINGTGTHNLENQYKIVYPQVRSHPSQYGNLNITNELVSNFEGVNDNKSSEIEEQIDQNKMENERLPIDQISVYIMLKRKLQKSKSLGEQQKLTLQLNEMENERAEISQKADTIVNLLGNNKISIKSIRVSPKMITHLECHHAVVKTIFKECQKIVKSPFHRDFITPMVNLCESGLNKDSIVAEIQKQCAN